MDSKTETMAGNVRKQNRYYKMGKDVNISKKEKGNNWMSPFSSAIF